MWRAAATPTLRAVNPDSFGIWAYHGARSGGRRGQAVSEGRGVEADEKILSRLQQHAFQPAIRGQAAGAPIGTEAFDQCLAGFEAAQAYRWDTANDAVITAYREEMVQVAGEQITGASIMLDGGVGGRVF